MRTLDVIDAERADLRSRRERIDADIRAIDHDYGYEVRNGEQVPKALPAGDRERLTNLERGMARLDEQDAALAAEGREQRMADLDAPRREAGQHRKRSTPHEHHRPGHP